MTNALFGFAPAHIRFSSPVLSEKPRPVSTLYFQHLPASTGCSIHCESQAEPYRFGVRSGSFGSHNMVGNEHSHLSGRPSEHADFVVYYPAKRGKGHYFHQWQCRHVERCWSFRARGRCSKSRDLITWSEECKSSLRRGRKCLPEGFR